MFDVLVAILLNSIRPNWLYHLLSLILGKPWSIKLQTLKSCVRQTLTEYNWRNATYWIQINYLLLLYKYNIYINYLLDLNRSKSNTVI